MSLLNCEQRVHGVSTTKALRVHLRPRTVTLGRIRVHPNHVRNEGSAMECGLTRFTSSGSMRVGSILGGLPNISVSSGKRIGCGNGTVSRCFIRNVSIANKHCDRVGGGLDTGTMGSTRVVRGCRSIGTLGKGLDSSRVTLGLGLSPRTHSR